MPKGEVVVLRVILFVFSLECLRGGCHLKGDPLCILFRMGRGEVAIVGGSSFLALPCLAVPHLALSRLAVCCLALALAIACVALSIGVHWFAMMLH